MALTPGLKLPYGIEPVNPLPVDTYSGPYEGSTEVAALTAANTSINSLIRFKSMEVRLIINGTAKKYWYKNGITDNDLIEFGTEWNSTNSALMTLSSNWQSTYATVCALSGNWASYNYLHQNFLPLSGGSVTGSLSVESKLYVKNGSAGSVTAHPSSVGIFESSGHTYLSLLAPDSKYSGIVMGGPGDDYAAYLSWNHDNADFKIATSHPGADIHFLVGNETEAMRIAPSTNIGIATSNPNEKLTVVGNVSATGSYYGDGSQLTGIVTGDTAATTLVRSNSGFWQTGYEYGTSYSSNSASFATNTTVNNASSQLVLNSDFNNYKTEVASATSILLPTSVYQDASGNWQSVFNTVQSNSATNWNYQGTDLKNLSANLQSVFNTVQSNSATNWDNSVVTSYVHNNFIPLSGGTITGNLSVLGNVTYLDTAVQVTSAMYIDTASSETALRITQRGPGDVIRVEDFDNPDTTPFIVNTDGLVGIGTATPNEKLTVVGNVSATGSYYGDGSQLTGIVTGDTAATTLVRAKSANWQTGYEYGTSYSSNSASFATNTLLQNTSALLTPITLTNILTSQLVLNSDFNNYKTEVTSATSILLPTSVYQSTSGNWQSVFNTVQSNSATNWNYQGTDLKNLSANLQSVFNTVQSNSATYIIAGGNSRGSNILIGTNDNFNLDLETNSVSRITILSSGNVGIGTVTPNERLTVNGNVTLNGLNLVYVTETKITPAINANTLTLDLTSASLFSVDLNANITTFTLTNVPTSPRVYSFTLQFIADGTLRAVTWPVGTRWSGATNPTLTSILNKIDTFTFVTHDGGSNWFAFVSDQNQ